MEEYRFIKEKVNNRLLFKLSSIGYALMSILKNDAPVHRFFENAISTVLKDFHPLE
jgi:hypothetical protein